MPDGPESVPVQTASCACTRKRCVSDKHVLLLGFHGGYLTIDRASPARYVSQIET